MKKSLEENDFAFSVIAFCLPFLFVAASFFDTAEPYNFLVFGTYLMEGSILGSVLGIILRICNRNVKNIKTYVLSMMPVMTLILSIIADFINERP